jgi:hypothetical protein
VCTPSRVTRDAFGLAETRAAELLHTCNDSCLHVRTPSNVHAFTYDTGEPFCRNRAAELLHTCNASHLRCFTGAVGQCFMSARVHTVTCDTGGGSARVRAGSRIVDKPPRRGAISESVFEAATPTNPRGPPSCPTIRGSAFRFRVLSRIAPAVQLTTLGATAADQRAILDWLKADRDVAAARSNARPDISAP